MSGSFTETVKANRQSYERFNAEKFQRFHQLLPSPGMSRILDAIPLLLCLNNPRLPGYVEADVPLGVCAYEPDDELLRFFKGRFAGVKLEWQHEKPFVEMVAIIGSVGTIAYNKKSDFDYWVCINRRTTTPEKYQAFRQKVLAVQKWAETELKLPVHLFVNDVESVRNNVFDEDEDEAFGSTVGALLKDEFYRSSIIVAGKIPFWWVVPQFTRDAEYEELYSRLTQEERDEQFVNLGNLYSINKDDFIGAALFQIIKSLGNPFKSIIKLGVLEKYLFESDEVMLISQKVRINVQRGNITNTILDSYLLMFEEVFDYYQKHNKDEVSLGILRQNLYLKINPQLSKYAAMRDRSSMPYKVEEMLRSVKKWQWNEDIIRELDAFDSWDYTRVMKFWDQVQAFMLKSYQRISGAIPSMNLKNMIPDSEFKLLSRKIRSHYTRAENKIDQFVTFKDTPSEALLYIEPVSHQSGVQIWRLYKKFTTERQKTVQATIKASPDLLYLMSWAALNHIYESGYSRLTVQSGYVHISQNLAQELMGALSDFFSESRMKIKNRYIVKPVFHALNFIILNFNLEDADAVKTVSYIYHTSWGESYIEQQPNPSFLVHALERCLQSGIARKKPFDEVVAFNIPNPRRCYRDIISMFRQAWTFLVEEYTDETRRFVTRIGADYVVVTRKGDVLETGTYPSLLKVATAITLKPERRVEYSIFDNSDPVLAHLAYVLQRRQPNTVTIFSENRGRFNLIYLLNETGNVFISFKEEKTAEMYAAYLYYFCKKTAADVKVRNSRLELDPDKVAVYTVQADRSGGNPVVRDETRRYEDLFFARYGNNHGYDLIIDAAGGATSYRLHFTDGTDSDSYSFQNLPMVAKNIQALKARGELFENIVRSITFNGAVRDAGTTLFLLQKFRVEFLLDRVVRS